MATTEGKPEIKQEIKPEAKPESKEVEENQEPPLKYKAWVLKVSIHCEGCKRKVEKTLRKIEGVYEAYADLKQQKATVKSNLHVNPKTLIKKLVKKGRHAELWPEKSEQKEKKQGKSKNKDKQVAQSEANNNSNHGDEKEKETVKNEASVHLEGGAKSSENGSESNKVAEGKQNVTRDQGGQVKEPKPEVKQNVTTAGGNQSAGDEKKVGGGESGGAAGESEANAAEKSGSGNGNEKNKKKGQKANANANVDEREHHGDAAPPTIGSHFKGHGPYGPVPMSSPANQSPPHQHPMYEYPTYYHAPPVYLTNYNTAYPSSSYNASYYTSPPPYSYAYTHSGHMSERPPPYLDTYSSCPSYSSQLSDSFEMFSDENPNACSIM
ncbi:40S ribosomal protein S21-2 [Hibiscus syriacus]|uniref:40S ribosomal protein S21-2 n=1 Tax=Hibiscus syriacus TaxID=106335 RepID=A0A6A2XRH3_HIBSY|nr:heavy metal-associated isoprenylated plant protein 36-like [Hibiscus syriacus]KAE8678182.1 40S ribosomal protein S21-2 [Hibiscus syriacus]